MKYSRVHMRVSVGRGVYIFSIQEKQGTGFDMGALSDVDYYSLLICPIHYFLSD